MRKLFCLLLCSILLNCASLATELQGGVEFNVDSAREYIQQGQESTIELTGPYYFNDENSAQKVVYSYNPDGVVIGITVQYKNEPNKAYIYGRNKSLIYIDKYDKPVNVYPHRGYRYDLEGKLILSSLSVSKSEQFRFSPDGRLIAHAINGVIYDENRNIIGRAKGQ